MTTAVVRALVALGACLVLGAVNYSIYGKERIIRTGTTILLELAPVDPRSLMQGDYMALRFHLADHIESARASSSLPHEARLAPLSLDGRGVATLASSPDSAAPHIRFSIRNGRVWLGTNAYFFEEGTADQYAGARYGEFRLDRATGEAVLVGLRDGPVTIP